MVLKDYETGSPFLLSQILGNDNSQTHTHTQTHTQIHKYINTDIHFDDSTRNLNKIRDVNSPRGSRDICSKKL